MKRSDTTGYTLDVDATEIVASKQTAEVTYKGPKGYMPMLGFLAENQLGSILERDQRFEYTLTVHRAFCLSVQRERIRQGDLFEQLGDDTYQPLLIRRRSQRTCSIPTIIPTRMWGRCCSLTDRRGFSIITTKA